MDLIGPPPPTSSPNDLFSLSIPSLGINAPVIPDVDGTDEAAYLAAIEHGVAQMAGSELPNQTGNLFIFGHSSYYKNKPGDYKEVFKHLDELKAGDRFTVTYQGQPYAYETVESKIVRDDDWSILDPTIEGSDRTVTLMTCWPPGTLQKRYVVIARQLPIQSDQ
jgi:sortase A